MLRQNVLCRGNSWNGRALPVLLGFFEGFARLVWVIRLADRPQRANAALWQRIVTYQTKNQINSSSTSSGPSSSHATSALLAAGFGVGGEGSTGIFSIAHQVTPRTSLVIEMSVSSLRSAKANRGHAWRMASSRAKR